MLNIVLPMVGRGPRFADAGYTLPKPLISVHGVPMIKVVTDDLAYGMKTAILMTKSEYKTKTFDRFK